MSNLYGCCWYLQLLPFSISGDIEFTKLRECLVNEKLINLIINIQFEFHRLFSFLLHYCVFPILDEFKVRLSICTLTWLKS